MNDNNNKKYEVINITFTEEYEEIDFPNDDLKPEFDTIHDWLSAVVQGNKPTKRIHKIEIGVIESPEESTLFLLGYNTIIQHPNSQLTTISFRPDKTFYKLPKDPYIKETANETTKVIESELLNFSKTQSFTTSFLINVDQVIFTKTGLRLWPR